MAGNAQTDLAAVAPTAADLTLGLATGVNITDQILAIKSNLQGAALQIQELANLTGLDAATVAALNVVATDLT